MCQWFCWVEFTIQSATLENKKKLKNRTSLIENAEVNITTCPLSSTCPVCLTIRVFCSFIAVLIVFRTLPNIK